jgi:hypothetical protein|tara:strand:+ start:1062 stop:1865 length:804 start_codon:yes stop_codon:yes gene_type:complete
MKNKGVTLLFLTLFMFSIIVNASVVSADIFSDFADKAIKFIDVFEEGKGTGVDGATIKWLVLMLVIILIYSALGYADFPENGALRFGLAIVVGLLATILITTDELVTTLKSYTALGLTLTLFLPILILTFFTMIVATKSNPFGILSQKIMWLIYSVYLFFKTGLLLLLKLDLAGLRGSASANPLVEPIYKFLYGKNFEKVASAVGSESFILLTLFISSIVIFIIFVWKNHAVTLWLAHGKREADVDKAKDRAARAKAGQDIYADATK